MELSTKEKKYFNVKELDLRLERSKTKKKIALQKLSKRYIKIKRQKITYKDFLKIIYV